MSGAKLRERCVAECIGTFMLVLIGPGAAAANAFSGGAVSASGVALAFAFVVTACVATFGALSGAHINPAVTLTLTLQRGFPARDAGPYVLAQCAGAIAAAMLLKAILGDHVASAATVPAVSLQAALALEFVFSFALMLVIAQQSSRSSAFAPLTIGLTVGFCALMGGPLTGASMNPARSLGPALAAGAWTSHWLYWVAPLAGMFSALQVHRFLHMTRTGGALAGDQR